LSWHEAGLVNLNESPVTGLRSGNIGHLG